LSGQIDLSSQSGTDGTAIINGKVIRAVNPNGITGRIGKGKPNDSGGGGGNANSLKADLSTELQTQILTLQTGLTPTDTTPVSLSGQNTATDLKGRVSKEQINAALVTSLDHDTVETLSTQGIDASASGNLIALEKGKVLFYPNSDITVRTKEADILIAAKSAVWVVETGNDVAVLDLSDNAGGDVKVVTNKEHMELRPGQMMVLTRALTAKFHEINPVGKITLRNLVARDMGDGIRGYHGEFSIMSALQNVPLLNTMVLSTNRGERQLADKMLKNAVILMTVQRAPIGYQSSEILEAQMQTLPLR
jgi:hypothetical protein